MAVLYDEYCYLFEFKVVESVPEGRAMAQLHSKKYYKKYQSRFRKITLVGVEFSKESRNIIGFELSSLENSD